MNVVIFSYHFLPMADAEAFCTARFASALADSGHKVIVVTMDWPPAVSDDVYNVLVSKKLHIERVPRVVPEKGCFFARLRYLTHEWEAINIKRCVKVLTSILKEEEAPILISRAQPIISLIVAWYCRKYAKRWIAHFSDPIPFYGKGLKRVFLKFWCSRAFRHADGISVTCDSALRFYKETYGEIFDEKKAFVTPHIGEPWLSSGTDNIKPLGDTTVPILVHTGLFYAGRGAGPLVDALMDLDSKGYQLLFVQAGEIDAPIRHAFDGLKNARRIDDKSPKLAAELVEKASASFVADLIPKMDYVPYMPSKFVYQLFTDCPMVVFSKKDSPMARVCREYSNSGLFFADADEPKSLNNAISQALSVDRNLFDRTKVRKQFSIKSVADTFVENVSSLNS